MSSPWALRSGAMLSFLSCLAFSRSVRAEGHQVLCVAERPTLFSARVCAEIESMGFEIVPARSLDEPGLPHVLAAARVLELPPPRRVELWLARGTGEALELSTVVEPSLGNDGDEASQTVRASEQLRAFFQPLREKITTDSPAAPETHASVTPAPLPSGARAPRSQAMISALPARTPRLRRLSTEAAFAASLELGGPGLDALLAAGWLLSPRLSVAGFLAVPIRDSTVRSGNNAASLSAALLGSELSLRLFDSRALRILASAGIAAAWLHTRGTATTPYTSRADDALVAVPLLGIEIAPRIAERVSLCLGARAGVALPKPVLTFAGKNVASWGRPLAFVSAGVGLDF